LGSKEKRLDNKRRGESIINKKKGNGGEGLGQPKERVGKLKVNGEASMNGDYRFGLGVNEEWQVVEGRN